MIGLVYKDFLVMHKQMGYYGVFLVIYAVLVVAGAFPVTILPGFVMLIGMLLPVTSFAYDDQARWDKYAAATPAGRGGMVGGKYIFALLCILAGALMVFLLQIILVLTGLVEGALPELSLAMLACSGLALLINAVVLPLMVKFGAEKSRTIMLVLFAAAFGGVTLLPMVRQKAGPLPVIPDWLLAALPVVFALVVVGGFAVSYFISVGIAEKKEL